MTIVGIVSVFLFRVVCLEARNTLNDLILPFAIFMLIAILYFANKRTISMKHYFNVLLIPGAGLLSAGKSIAQNPKNFYLNESFATWLICVLFSGIASTKAWYTTVLINLFCFVMYIYIILNQYGLDGVRPDLYVHITTCYVFSSLLIKVNEENMRSSFNLLKKAELQEKKWQHVLEMLTDGVLIMQHTQNDNGILLVNPSLRKIFKIIPNRI